MTYNRIYLHRFHDMNFRICLSHKTLGGSTKRAEKVSNTKVSSSSHEIMVEDADYVDKVAKRAMEIIFHAEWEKSVLKSQLLVQ